MPTALKPIIFGKSKKVDFDKFNIGNVLKAIAFDLEEFGQKGVQGVKIAENYKRLISYEKKAKRAKSPYIQAGVAKGSLWLVVRDNDDAKFEAIDLLVKDYDKLKKTLAQNSASVTDIGPNEDAIISRSVKDTGKKLGVKPSQDPNFGEITGNIVLTAHGRPAVMPSGRVIGDRLGRKTPKEIVELLTGSKDPKKRIPLTFNGQITLCGCFTASGGPEGEEQDDPFAKKVRALLVKKGYKKASVVGYPGATITVSKGGADSKGTRVRRGDEKVLANQATGKDKERAKKLEAVITKALKARNDLVDPYNSALAAQVQAAEAHKTAKGKETAALAATREAFREFGGSEKDFKETKEGKQLLSSYVKAKKAAEKALKLKNSTEKAFGKAEKAFDKADTTLKKARETMEKSGLGDTYARLEGRFGLREIN
jgi:hypothetical protein